MAGATVATANAAADSDITEKANENDAEAAKILEVVVEADERQAVKEVASALA
jgi:hypothetical protein